MHAAKVTKYIGSGYEIRDASGTNEVAVKSIFLGDFRIAEMHSDGKEFFLHTDHLNSTNVITSGNEEDGGEQVQLYEYAPYGQTTRDETSEDVILSDSEESLTSYKFTGQEEDAEVGLYYYHARYYDPELGRFIQADSIVQSPYDPQTLNRYAYCRNNPVKFTDPSGNIFFTIFAIISAVASFIAANAATIATIASIVSLASMGAAIIAAKTGHMKAAKVFGMISTISGYVAMVAGGINVAAGFMQVAAESGIKIAVQTGVKQAVQAATDTVKGIAQLGKSVAGVSVKAVSKTANLTKNIIGGTVKGMAAFGKSAKNLAGYMGSFAGFESSYQNMSHIAAKLATGSLCKSKIVAGAIGGMIELGQSIYYGTIGIPVQAAFEGTVKYNSWSKAYWVDTLDDMKNFLHGTKIPWGTSITKGSKITMPQKFGYWENNIFNAGTVGSM